jgi:zinc protease
VILSGEGYGGESLYGEKDFINLKVFDDVIGISGLGNFSSTELEKALAGKIANANLTMDGDKYMGVNGSSTPKDVETMLQMLYLYFTNINKDEKSFQKLIGQYEVSLKNRELSPDIALSDSLTATLFGHDKRRKPLLAQDLSSISYDRILQIARERTATAKDWVFRIIGNFDEATIRPLICQYIASLPAKGKVVKGYRTSNLQKGKIENIFKRKQETPKCNTYLVWFNEDMDYTPERSIQASIAGQIMRMIYTKEIREEASAAYSVSAGGNASISDDYHVIELVAYCPMQPEKKDTAMLLLVQAVENLAKTCDVEMLNKCKEVMLKRYDEQVKNNGYWNSIIQMWRKYGLDEHTDYKALVQAQTPEKISAFVREVISAGNCVNVTMLPEE